MAVKGRRRRTLDKSARDRTVRLDLLAINDFHDNLEPVLATSSSGRINNTPAGYSAAAESRTAPTGRTTRTPAPATGSPARTSSTCHNNLDGPDADTDPDSGIAPVAALTRLIAEYRDLVAPIATP